MWSNIFLLFIFWHVPISKIMLSVFYFQTSNKQRPEVSKALRPIQNAGISRKLRLADFTVLVEAGSLTTRAGTFYSATYGNTKTPVTLSFSIGEAVKDDLDEDTFEEEDDEKSTAFSLCPLAKFFEAEIPASLVDSTGGHVQGK